MDGFGDLLVVEVSEVGVVTNGGLQGGPGRLDGSAGLLDLESLLGNGLVELADAVDDLGVGSEVVGAGLFGGFERSGVAAKLVFCLSRWSSWGRMVSCQSVSA